jgi:hypothetical protein
VAFSRPFFWRKIMSAFLYRQDKDGKIVSETVSALSVARMLKAGYKADPKDFEEKKVEKKETKSKKKG